MSLVYKVGDLIKAAQSGEVNVIAHGCNCYCTMGSGIAPLIKKAFPEAYAADLKTKKGDLDKKGTLSWGQSGEVTIANLYSQGGYWGRNEGIRDLDYDALYDSLVRFAGLAKNIRGNETRIGLPKIGAGLAKGDWEVIETMIKTTLRGLDVTIYVLDQKEIPSGAEVICD
ncbi:hypothetical protein pEaSNUABM56_00043 [Erwinia phage pEa_SNUABM_56]|uniref:Macro domain-containing protein n=1 Tax=Erwinia phage pEp_SNUABM_01 TaxID=2601643 RepID=A0A5J6DB49_9CAUD|nr:phosphatase [Erwinia phage pEp_SNUABM_01]QEQ94843.1 hypothetical protein pEpSNUABM01_017 [Erwinia phage pEp_SNUABM_01]UYL85021.1 hypothetical protein pEaSNUABM55_00248 [Erwinia phage pEa_SNUABM_55]UYL85088.1 hypothetical protein pEaSNUABM56_00043 [Erwinia phage pEa_SNUABM_56]